MAVAASVDVGRFCLFSADLTLQISKNCMLAVASQQQQQQPGWNGPKFQELRDQWTVDSEAPKDWWGLRRARRYSIGRRSELSVVLAATKLAYWKRCDVRGRSSL